MTKSRDSHAIDAHWDARLRSAPPPPRDVGKRTSQYLTTRDGTRIAIDITLPSSFRAGDKLATMLRQTRYFRSVEVPRALDFQATRDSFDIAGPTRERFLAQGYAWVDVDVRGSGVSSGTWPGPWTQNEVKDGADVVELIIRQPWSNGRVGSTGISYEGTTSEMLLVNQHEAVKAVAPRFSLLCAYEDVAFPGGAHLSWFTKGWARYNRLLDDHRYHRAMAELVYVITRTRGSDPHSPRSAWLARELVKRIPAERLRSAIASVFGVFMKGGRRVDEDASGVERERAILEHVANGDVHEMCLEGVYRDASLGHRPEVAFSIVSPRGNLDAIRGSGAAIYGYGGWFDGGYAQAAGRRFASLGRTQLLLGPWTHAGFIAQDPERGAAAASFPHDLEILRFFDRELRGRDDEGPRAPVVYFTLAANQWKHADSWPPANVRAKRLYFGSDRTLTVTNNAAHELVPVRFDESFGVGERSRWRGLLAGFVPADYPDFTQRSKHQLLLQTQPLEQGWTVTGHPVLRLRARAGARGSDFILLAYLVDVNQDGRRTVVTEGALRALHRKPATPEAGYQPLTPIHSFFQADAAPVAANEEVELELGMLPVSYWFAPRHCVGLVLTLGDHDHYAPLREGFDEIALFPNACSIDLPLET